MMPHDILTFYSAKAIEYLLAVVFLVSFVPFWKFVMGGATATAHVSARDAMKNMLSHWFQVPDATFFHPGHAWARADGNGVLTVGMDDFAQKLVGKVERVELPPVGARLVQGESGWTIAADSKAVDMLAPVGGIVVEVNQAALQDAGAVNRDPYGSGWLLKLKSPRATAHLATLRAGAAARRWMDEVCEGLTTTMTPALGHVYQDGGLPVDGIARTVAGQDWDALARQFLLTDGEGEEQKSA